MKPLLNAAFAILLATAASAQLAPPLPPITQVPELLKDHDAPEIKAASGLTGKDLLKELTEKARRGHKPLFYSDAKKKMFSDVDNVEQDGARGVIASYSGIFVAGTSDRGHAYREGRDQNGDGFVDKAMNAEHIWPQSFFKEREPMRGDLHNLMPTFMHPNSVRGRLPFGEVSSQDADYETSNGARRGEKSFEPPGAVKGQVARAMLYFYVRYQGTNFIPSNFVDSFWNQKIELLLKWNSKYAPTDEERERNDRVEKVQGNRNPFIDDHTLADRIGKDALRMQRSRKRYSNGRSR